MIIKCKRQFNISKLITDQSIEVVERYNIENWMFVSNIYKSFENLPLNQSWKYLLKNSLLEDPHLYILKINNPNLLSLRISQNETKTFIFSNSGFLIEPEFYGVWDKYFPFIERDDEDLSFQLPDNIPTHSDDNTYIWSNHSCNFSHFMLDHFSKLVILNQNNPNIFTKYQVPFFTEIPDWQHQYHQLINVRCHSLSNIFDQMNSTAFFFKPKQIYFPYFNNYPLGLDVLRNFIKDKVAQDIIPKVEKINDYSIIFLTRNDARRSRIANIEQIENYIISIGGKVIDPIKLSLEERAIAFGKRAIFIGESSGCMNFGLFASNFSKLISLVDPNVLKNSEFLYGGWPYALGYADRTSYVVGKNPGELINSPLGTATYPLIEIKNLINHILDHTFPDIF